jgi:hypothetical protein
MSTKKIKLTTRQHRLADLIEKGDGRRFTKREIYEAVEGYEWHEDASDKCPAIRTDMKAINASSERDAIIVFDHQKYYYATYDEVLAFIDRKKRTISVANKEIYVLKKKLAKHGQGKVLNNQLNPISDSDEQYHTTVRE